VNGGWSSWLIGGWSSSCGPASRTWSRSCSNPTPSCGGAGCSGSATWVQDTCCINAVNGVWVSHLCWRVHAHTLCFPLRVVHFVATCSSVEASLTIRQSGWSGWWPTCVSSGAVASRTRSCSASCGGAACAGDSIQWAGHPTIACCRESAFQYSSWLSACVSCASDPSNRTVSMQGLTHPTQPTCSRLMLPQP
jgi:hypothetical protein